MKRDFLSLLELSSTEIEKILDVTEKLKKGKIPSNQFLKGKSIGLVFQKPSNRTRVSFDIGIYQLGGHCLYLSPREINLGVRESTADVARTLSRYLNGIVARTFTHQDVVELAKYASVPVINGLSDLYHPCQALTDIFSIKEKLGTLKGLTLAYVGDGNNVCHSLLIACSKVGIHVRVATPKGYEPKADVIKEAKKIATSTQAQITLTNGPKEAVKGAHVIYSDVWISMGQEEEAKKRLKKFKGFQINKDLVKRAEKDFIFMHCMPAHRGQEVSADVIDGPHSIVFDQAENRLHTQKAIIMFLFEHQSATNRG